MRCHRSPAAPGEDHLTRNRPREGPARRQCATERRNENRERPLPWTGKGALAARPDGNEGRQNNLIIGLGSNPVHTRSSGAIRKEHQPSNTCSTGGADGNVRHVFYLPLRLFTPTSKPWPPNASTAPMGARHDEAMFPLSSAIARTARGGSAVTAQGAHLRRGQAR